MIATIQVSGKYLQWLAVSIHLSEMMTHPQKWLLYTCNEPRGKNIFFVFIYLLTNCLKIMFQSYIGMGLHPHLHLFRLQYAPMIYPVGKLNALNRAKPYYFYKTFLLREIEELTYMIGDIETVNGVQHTAQNKQLKFHYFRFQISFFRRLSIPLRLIQKRMLHR